MNLTPPYDEPDIKANATLYDDDPEAKRPDSIFTAWYHGTLAAGLKGWCRLICALVVYLGLLGPLVSTPDGSNYFLSVSDVFVGGWRICSADGQA